MSIALYIIFEEIENIFSVSIEFSAIAPAILAFWLVLLDLLEDRRTIDVIIIKFFPLHFKMAERCEI